MRTIIVVGQTTPAHSGQVAMISGLLQCDLPGYYLVHVPMNFSASMAEMNRGGVRKVAVLVKLIFSLWAARVRTGAEILYYPPAGPDLRPVLRDIVALLATRWCFRYTIFHFHAGGGVSHAEELPGVIGRLARLAYRRPALGIRSSLGAPRDDLACDAMQDAVVECYAEDIAGYGLRRSPSETLYLVFIGVLVEDKGVSVLIEAMRLLAARGVRTTLALVGEFSSDTYRADVEKQIAAAGLTGMIRFTGVLHGRAKAQALVDADLMVFPSFFHAETFGIVLAEAMSAGIPIVTTNWRGIPCTVTDGQEGLIVPVRSPEAVAAAVASLADDPERRAAMGLQGRRTYERRFTATRFAHEIRAAFDRIPRNP